MERFRILGWYDGATGAHGAGCALRRGGSSGRSAVQCKQYFPQWDETRRLREDCQPIAGRGAPTPYRGCRQFDVVLSDPGERTRGRIFFRRHRLPRLCRYGHRHQRRSRCVPNRGRCQHRDCRHEWHAGVFSRDHGRQAFVQHRGRLEQSR